jgi:hypothetical protein
VDALAGRRQVIGSPAFFIAVSIGRKVAGMGTVKDLAAPPLGEGNVIVPLSKSTQRRGIWVSAKRQPVAKEISKATRIHSFPAGRLAKAMRTRSICSGVKTGLIRRGSAYLRR